MHKMSSSNERNKMDGMDNTHLASALVSSGLSVYKWGKAFTVAQLPILEKPLEFAQQQVVSVATGALAHAHLTPEAVISTLDSKTLDLVVYLDAEKKYVVAKDHVAKPIKLIADAKDVACARASGFRAQASHTVDAMLAGTERVVDSYLPANAPENEFDADETKVARFQSLSLVTSRRLKKSFVDKVSALRLQEKVQLDRCVEFLDMEAVRERVSSSAVGSKVLNSESYATFKGFVVTRAMPCAENLGNQFGKYKNDLMLSAEARVLVPVKDFYAIAAAEFIKMTKCTEDFFQNPKENLLVCQLSAEEFAAKYVAMVKAACGEGWSEKLAQPTESFLELCKSTYGQIQKTVQVERVEAFVAALRVRLASEWETRVKSAVAKRTPQ